jgi:hypothetical protein
MHELQVILNKYSNQSEHDCLVRDIEIYIAKQHILNILEVRKNCVRIFPRDGSHYIELTTNHGIEEKMYVAFHKLYELGIHNYIDAMHFYGGNLSFHVKTMYSLNDVKEIFDNHFKHGIPLYGDCLTYDFDEKYFSHTK